MQGIKEMKEMLFEELALIVRTTSELIRKVSPEDWDYKPQENMRSLQELVQHLVFVPSTDLLILNEGTEQELRTLEAEVAAEADHEILISKMTAGLRDVRMYMESLSDEDFLHKKTTPFYLQHGTAQAKWLIEIVTHAQHHRAQFFTYLKTLGYEVNMFNLYLKEIKEES